MRTTLARLLQSKPRRLVTADTTSSVGRAVRAMNEAEVGSVLVVDSDQLVGIFTERDVLRVVDLGAPPETPLAEVMTTPVLCASSQMEVGRAMRFMTDHRTRHVPVVDDGKLLGIVSLGDLTHWVTRELKRTVTDLSRYICGPAVMVPFEAPSDPEVAGDDERAWSWVGVGVLTASGPELSRGHAP